MTMAMQRAIYSARFRARDDWAMTEPRQPPAGQAAVAGERRAVETGAIPRQASICAFTAR